MAPVVSLSIVVTQKLHPVPLRNILGVLVDEFFQVPIESEHCSHLAITSIASLTFNGLPQCWDRLDIFKQ